MQGKLFASIKRLAVILLIIIYIFFRGHIFISTNGVIFFAESQVIIYYGNENNVRYALWINGIRVYVFVEFPISMTFDINGVSTTIINAPKYIVIIIGSNEYIYETNKFSNDWGALLNFDEEQVESSILSVRRLSLIREYFSRNITRTTSSESFLIVEGIGALSPFNYLTLLWFIFHYLLHFHMVEKRLYAMYIDKNSMLYKRKIIVIFACIFSYSLLTISITSRFVSIM